MRKRQLKNALISWTLGEMIHLRQQLRRLLGSHRWNTDELLHPLVSVSIVGG
jgi:hypothetical protein